MFGHYTKHRKHIITLTHQNHSFKTVLQSYKQVRFYVRHSQFVVLGQGVIKYWGPVFGRTTQMSPEFTESR